MPCIASAELAAATFEDLFRLAAYLTNGPDGTAASDAAASITGALGRRVLKTRAAPSSCFPLRWQLV
jgi:hypothetical protein